MQLLLTTCMHPGNNHALATAAEQSKVKNNLCTAKRKHADCLASVKAFFKMYDRIKLTHATIYRSNEMWERESCAATTAGFLLAFASKQYRNGSLH